MPNPVVIVCPGDLVTGGPELLHQLARTLSDAGVDASILYHPFDRAFSPPAAYARYQVAVTRLAQVPEGAKIVLPETLAGASGAFPHAHVVLWWLSVDNYFSALGAARIKTVVPRTLVRRLRPYLGRFASLVRRALKFAVAADPIAPVRGFAMHLHQSEYARQFLVANRLGPTARLGDYVNELYLNEIGRVEPFGRQSIVAYNPAKGAEQTEAIRAEAARSAPGRATFVPIVNMTRDQVVDLLSRAKLYTDFGNHPGKDRIPREAAALGACVVTNRRGSAGNAIDVPIDDDFKVDDTVPGFERDAVKKILAVLDDFEGNARRFDAYRRRIADEPREFAEDAAAIFAS